MEIFVLVTILSYIEFGPANLKLVISNSQLFRTQNHFPCFLPLSDLLSAISNYRFVSPES